MVVHSKAIAKQNLKIKKSVFPMKDRFYKKYSQRSHQRAHTKKLRKKNFEKLEK